MKSDLIDLDILCFTEHLLTDNQTGILNIDHFILVSKFSRFSSTHGGSCIFVWKDWRTKEVNYLQGMGSEKVFETSIVELLGSKFTFACI